MRGGGADLDALVDGARSQFSSDEGMGSLDVARTTSGSLDYAWFRDLVIHSEQDAALRLPTHHELCSWADRWSHRILDSEPSDERAGLVEAHVTAQLVNEGAIDHPLDCARAPVGGDADPLRTAGQGVMIAFLHTGLASVLFNATVATAARAVFMPSGRPSPQGLRETWLRPKRV
jgi:hypothetical protein